MHHSCHSPGRKDNKQHTARMRCHSPGCMHSSQRTARVRCPSPGCMHSSQRTARVRCPSPGCMHSNQRTARVRCHSPGCMHSNQRTARVRCHSPGCPTVSARHMLKSSLFAALPSAGDEHLQLALCCWGDAEGSRCWAGSSRVRMRQTSSWCGAMTARRMRGATRWACALFCGVALVGSTAYVTEGSWLPQ
jgi:hypothetical protein